MATAPEPMTDKEQGSSRSPHSDNAESQVDRYSIDSLTEFAQGACELLERLYGEDLSFWTANAITHQSLRDVILLERGLRSLTLTQDNQRRMFGRLTSILPLDEADRQHLLQSITSTDPSIPWYENADPEDILLVDRWRQWLVHAFDESRRDEPDNQGRLLVETLEQLWNELAEYPGPID